MYLHIGNNTIVKTESIIGIFDMDTATVSETTKEWLRRKRAEGSLLDNTDKGLPKSIVLTDKNAYMTRLNTVTLKKRAEESLF